MNNNSHILPVITLHQPWATWVIRGWKTIETRTHSRFKCLEGRRILIHAGQANSRFGLDNPYLTKEQIEFNPSEIVNGFILGSAFVSQFKLLNSKHSKCALIECESIRYGLILENVDRWETPIAEKGGQGIWYYDTLLMHKVPKPKNNNQPKLF